MKVPSHGTVVSYIALFSALGGTAFALEASSITEREIATGAVRSSEIATGAVKRSEIKTGAVGSAEIRTDAVRARELRAGSVSADELAPGAVGAVAIADDAIGPEQIKPGALGSSDFADLAVTTEKLFDGAVTTPKIGADAIDASKVKDGSLTLADLAQGVANVTFDPPIMTPGDCLGDAALAVPNKQAGDTVWVFPGTAAAGWHGELTLDGYASRGSGSANTISVVLCRPFGAGPVDPGPQPLTVLLFR